MVNHDVSNTTSGCENSVAHVWHTIGTAFYVTRLRRTEERPNVALEHRMLEHRMRAQTVTNLIGISFCHI